MEAYPADYIVHNLPFVLLSGLESAVTETPVGGKTQEYLGDGGFRIRADLPPLHHSLKDDLRTALLAYDYSNAPWHPPTPDHQSHVYRIRSVGRAYTFPPRKAPPPAHSPRMRPSDNNGLSPAPLTLHSTLSPLSPSSPLYPDGIISPVWITKHQHRLPSVLIAFYNLVADASTSSLEDNKIKNEVNAIRNVISSTNYKTRFVIVLVADGPINGTELEERLVNLRRGTNFDSKALYFLPSSATTIEIKDFARVLLATVHPAAIEYYRDLSKHARRKRNRNAVPQPTVLPSQGTSSILPLQGWNLRYEFKLGIFAETRQELEAASKSYEAAYDGLYHSELLGEAIPTWSARFNEARMLADVIALRIIRCFLWSVQTTNAVRWWTKHRDRIQEIIERRGKGVRNYGWEAWQATWAKVMAELVQRSEVFPISLAQLPAGSSPLVNLPPRLSISSDRQLPWETLHHEGYWLDKVRKHLIARRELAADIPEDIDPLESVQSPRDQNAISFDTYLCPNPVMERQLLLTESGDSYLKRIELMLKGATQAFASREQTRMIEALRCSLSRELSISGDWPDSMAQLSSLSQNSSWEKEGWYPISLDLKKSLFEAAKKSNNDESVCRFGWELSACQVGPIDINPAQLEADVATAVDLQSTLPVISVSFAFSSDSGHVGEQIAAQLVIQRQVEALPFGLEVAEIKVTFEGGVQPLLIEHLLASKSGIEAASIQPVDLVSNDTSTQNKRLSLTGAQHWHGQTDLGLQTSRVKILNLNLIPFEAGMVTVTSITLLLQHGKVELSLYTNDLSHCPKVWWETRNSHPSVRDFGSGRDVSSISVLPKPPKVDIKVSNLADLYYTNEVLDLSIIVENHEEEDISSGELVVKLLSPPDHTAKLQWKHDGVEAPSILNDTREATLPALELRDLASTESKEFNVLISDLIGQCEHGLEITASYTVGADETQNRSVKRMTFDIPVIRPFEANALFQPRYHTEDWPNFFAAPQSTDTPQGLKQQYLAKLEIGCFARTPLTINSLELAPKRIIGNTICTAQLSADEHMPVQAQPEKTTIRHMDMILQKQTLGDRDPVAVDMTLNVQWSRPGSTSMSTSTLLLPRFMASMAEPRVLLRAHKMKMPQMYRLEYTIENSSMHFLTFSLTMESGDGFAFSGPKSTSVSLTPISRVDVPYRLLMSKTQEWVRVHLEVLDAFFGQTLRIQPASNGVMVDKQGNILVWAD